jgi:hypothetical protein
VAIQTEKRSTSAGKSRARKLVRLAEGEKQGQLMAPGETPILSSLELAPKRGRETALEPDIPEYAGMLLFH